MAPSIITFGAGSARAFGFAVAKKIISGGLWTWGQNNLGQLGLVNTIYYSSPKQVGTSTNWSSISGGAVSFHATALKTDGTLWTWGRNNYGQLGFGNTAAYSSPKQVGVSTTWSSIINGGYHTLAIKTDGTLWSWGLNNCGQLGFGNRTNYSSPKQVGSLTNWLRITAGYYHTIALKTDGTLWTWGKNRLGQLGLGNITYYSSPKQVGNSTDWSSINSGTNHTLAIKTDGTLWTWGFNGSGQLGLNTAGLYSSYSSPVQVGALTNWSKVSVSDFSVAIKTDGTLWSWGNNLDGQLGLGNRTYYSSPKQVGALTNWSNIIACWRHDIALKTNGTLWTWGFNNYGQLGLGTSGIGSYYSSPKQIGSLTTWSNISGGYSFTIGIHT